jgi:hypothetical protein
MGERREAIEKLLDRLTKELHGRKLISSPVGGGLAWPWARSR